MQGMMLKDHRPAVARSEARDSGQERRKSGGRQAIRRQLRKRETADWKRAAFKDGDL